MTFTIAQKLAEVRREIALRKSVYPVRVAAGKMTINAARFHLATMEAIEADYARAAGLTETGSLFADAGEAGTKNGEDDGRTPDTRRP